MLSLVWCLLNLKQLILLTSEEQEREELLDREENEDEKNLLIIPFKANPVKKYKPLEIHRSDIPLTQPASPKFLTDLRAQ